MADVRPLPGIRYAAADQLAALVTPPYDVIAPDAQASYYARHPDNIIRLELGRDEPGDDALNNRYTRAAATFAEWRLRGVLRQDAPALYLYEQRFTWDGREYRRLSLLARVRLEPWEAGIILPHEYTLAKPKDDRLKLLRACAANLSPLLALYDDPDHELARLLAPSLEAPAATDFTDETGERHRLWALRDESLAHAVAAFFAPRQLYMADGHHRYETALAYRDEQAASRKADLPSDDAARFTLLALSAVEDSGLLVLPTHRILRELDPAAVAALPTLLDRHFTVEPLAAPVDAPAALARLAEAHHAGETAFIAAGLRETLLLRLRPAGRAAMDRAGDENDNASDAWRRLDLAVLHELVLRDALGISGAMVRAGEHISYTRDAAVALAAAHDDATGGTLALLVNATPPAAIRDVAHAGGRMPQKSTYFYPKLITGLVINPLW
ncbi:MAG TPA: DUF1015 domain-containing protein [Ktedonobacterales bacterium]|nr:DUF1015 domain-containing protein [Ktedonobacterales bacterium]